MRNARLATPVVALLLGVGTGVALDLPSAAGQGALPARPEATGPAQVPSPSSPPAPAPGGAGAGGPPADLADPARIAEGRQQFKLTCAVAYCHGPEGRIGGGAPSLRGREVGTPRSVYSTIANGRRRMPAWKSALPPEKIWSLVAYVLSLESETP